MSTTQRDSAPVSLRSLARMAGTPREVTPPTRDDSGLIDLRALAEAQGKSGVTPKVEVPVVTTGLFDVPAVAAPVVEVPAHEVPKTSPRWKTLVIPGAMVAAAAMILGGFFLMQGRTRQGESASLNAGSPEINVPERGASASNQSAETQPGDSKAADSKAADSKAADSKAADAKTPEASSPESTAKTPSSTAKTPPTQNKLPSRNVAKPPGSGAANTGPSKVAPPCDLMCQMQKSVAGKH